jgi:hypothetical protein
MNLDQGRLAALRSRAERAEGGEDALELHARETDRWGGRVVELSIVRDGAGFVVRRPGRAAAAGPAAERFASAAALLAGLGPLAERTDWEASV